MGNSRLSFGSVFSGGGLVEAGIADLFDLAFAVEYDGAIADVYRANFGDHVRVAAAQDVPVSTLPPVDVLWASPPCQAHSVARSGKLAARDDAEVGIVVLDYVKATNPRYVFIENVEGYARHPVFRRIVDGLFRLGYWVRFDVLNAADFGVPQTRRRLILRAVKDSLVPMLPAPVPWVGWYSAIEDLIPTLPETTFAPWQLKRLPEIYATAMVEGDVAGARDIGIRGVDAPMWTVKANAAKSNMPYAFILDCIGNKNGTSVTVRDASEPVSTVSVGSAQHPYRAWINAGRVVRMTAQALGRFQSLPDSYILPGKNSLACKVIGNGVASRFARAIITATVQEV